MEDLKSVLRILMSITILVALLALISLIVVEKRQQEETGIIGTWETTVNILGEGVEQGKTGTMALRLGKDAAGQLISPADLGIEPKDFTYSVTEDTLEIQFSDGTIWSFPYQLEGNTLTLTQNHCEVPYTRVK